MLLIIINIMLFSYTTKELNVLSLIVAMCCYVVLSNITCNCGVLFILCSTIEPCSFLFRYICLCSVLFCYNDYTQYNNFSTFFLDIRIACF